MNSVRQFCVVEKYAVYKLILCALLVFSACDSSDHHQHGTDLKMVPLESAADSAQYRLWLGDLPQYSQHYDPVRDPNVDLQAAMHAATEMDKSIFMLVGGDWCSWCYVMTRFFAQETELQRDLLENYELLKINMSESNPNVSFLAGYPEIEGYPHIFILSASGELMHAQDTFALQAGEEYSVEKFERLLDRFSALE